MSKKRESEKERDLAGPPHGARPAKPPQMHASPVRQLELKVKEKESVSVCKGK